MHGILRLGTRISGRIQSVNCVTCTPVPSERQRRKSSARTDRPRERIVGAKNMHSSSGCAVIRSIRPVTSRSVEPAAVFIRSHERATTASRTSRSRNTSSNIPLLPLSYKTYGTWFSRNKRMQYVATHPLISACATNPHK